MSEERMPDRARALETAAEYVLRQRNKSYGEPDANFQRIANLWSAFGFRFEDGEEIRELRGSDVSILMMLLKSVRLGYDPGHEDSWIDIAGYAACGLETANLQESRGRKGLSDIADEAGAIIGATINPSIVRTLTLSEREAANRAMTGDPADLEGMGLMIVDVKHPPKENACHKCGQPYLPPGHHAFNGLCLYSVAYRRSDG